MIKLHCSNNNGTLIYINEKFVPKRSDSVGTSRANLRPYLHPAPFFVVSDPPSFFLLTPLQSSFCLIWQVRAKVLEPGQHGYAGVSYSRTVLRDPKKKKKKKKAPINHSLRMRRKLTLTAHRSRLAFSLVILDKTSFAIGELPVDW